MTNKIHITDPAQLHKQEEGIFSVDGRYKYKYDQTNPQKTFGVVAVDLKDINENSTIYKLGSLKS